MSEYGDLLEDKRWLLKKKRIRNRDHQQCTVCTSKIRLEVHHTYYYKQQTAPWAYPDESLLTLCHKCHRDWHDHSELVIIDRPEIKKRKKKVVKPTKKQPKKKNKEPREIKIRHPFTAKVDTPIRYRKKTEEGYKYFSKDNGNTP